MAAGSSSSRASADIQLVVADIPEDQQPLVCVEYPGFVDSDERALSSMGGVDAVSNAYFQNQLLEVRLRPEDKYCKPIVARATRTTNLVLRVKRRKRPTLVVAMETSEVWGEKEGNESSKETLETMKDKERPLTRDGSVREPQYEYSADVMGFVNVSFEFPGMADFQVLPPGLSTVSKMPQAVDPSIFQLVEPMNESQWAQDVPSFLPPQIFSKFDKPISYHFRPDPKPKSPASDATSKQRSRKMNQAHIISFNHKGPVPTQPHPESVHTNHPKLAQLRQLFEERPIWSRLALQFHLNVPNTILRSLLVLVSYYFTSGPWKALWVKFGYDPRKHPEAKMYQCLDFRLPKEVDIVESEWNKRTQSSSSSRPYSTKSRRTRVFRLSREPDSSGHQLKEEGQAEAGELAAVNEAAYVFTPDRLPSQRQLFYQLCDLREDGLQEIVHSGGGSGRETVCSELTGWCEEGTYDKLRKALQEITKKTAERMKSERRGVSTTSQSGAELGVEEQEAGASCAVHL